MGIIFKQSFKNTLIIYLGFIVGGINTIFLYPRILESDYYGLTSYLLAYSNLIMPLTAFGIQYTIVKFFSSYINKEEKDRFLTASVFLPLLIALPIGLLWSNIHTFIVNSLNKENAIVEDYTIVIYIVAVCCAYFEVFYSWAKVQLHTVFGNILKEFWNRAMVMMLLGAVFMNWITKPEFICILTATYILRTLLMMGYAFYLYLPKFSFKLPKNFKEIIKYSGYIILAGSASAIILDIDKVMIPDKETFEKAAYYTVAVFIGSFIEAPGRAMAQILQPLTSQSLNENNSVEVENLYKKSSINLLLIGGLFFLLVNCNISELFRIMPEKGYAGGELVVLMISSMKLYTMFLGNNTSIIGNSQFYRITLPIGVGMALSVYLLNRLFYFNLEMSTDGLALSTLVTIFIFNTYKIWFVKKKFGMTPFTDKSWQMIAVIIVLFVGFYFWNFSLPKFSFNGFPLHPLLNIILKSVIIVLVYLFLVFKLKISFQVNMLLKKIIK
ncbi:lipopolysaccharide biosynthesis protein [Tenacibaculum sp. IB213877]|uniref:lipopolysaccharide biosynthesis protein n=1 Tax=Tenacibaculum sp. IB213877 TaxID=3097351 RepID=UPI002A5A3AC3|nr:oligosaccharide flippase family protein [Tenacibaculum sp. IB213877]MDY0781167.1 oligosaccharide flippase family protein [Tenacibaculum sp. IB213877]